MKRQFKSHLDKWCPQCKSQLVASQHPSGPERKKRDDKKEFCNGKCAAIYKSENIQVSGVSAMDYFILGVRS